MFRSLGQSLRAVNHRDLSKDPRLQLMSKLWISLSEQQQEDVCRQTFDNLETSADTNSFQMRSQDNTLDLIRQLDDLTRQVIRQHQKDSDLQDNCQFEVGSVLREVTNPQELQALVQIISQQMSIAESGEEAAVRDASNLSVIDQSTYSILSAVMENFCSQSNNFDDRDAASTQNAW